MRPRNGDYGVFPRKLGNGKEIYYYWTYDSDGKRKFRSTGETTYEGAIKVCRSLLKKGQLLTEKQYAFSTFTEHLFIYEECPYIQNRLMKGKTYSRSWAAQERRILVGMIQPHFTDRDLREITEREIDDWVMSLRAERKGAKTINHVITILKIVFGFAVKERLIEENPCEHIEPFALMTREKGIFTNDELERLFKRYDLSLWKSEAHFALNMTAAVTGMRLGELLGLRICMVNGNVITVANAWNPLDGLKSTKNGKVREIPIPEVLGKLIDRLAFGRDSQSYVFSPGSTPIDHKTVYKHFSAALNGIGIPPTERLRRNITFHSYRHTFNTRLIESGMNPETVRLLTGHTAGMTARYSHIQLSRISLPELPFAIPS